MNNSNRIHYPSNTEWNLLGELELSVNASAETMIQSWIAEVLIPLNLSPAFLNRVVQAAHESAIRYLHPDTELALGHIHLSFYVPKQILTKGKTWGVFHIERIQNNASSAVASDHTIEFYLYVEGD